MTEEERVIPLDAFLKLRGLVGSGGEAKILVQGGEVEVNEEVETRRRRKLRAGDRVMIHGSSHLVEAEDLR